MNTFNPHLTHILLHYAPWRVPTGGYRCAPKTKLQYPLDFYRTEMISNDRFGLIKVKCVKFTQYYFANTKRRCNFAA